MTIASKIKTRINRSKRYVFARADFTDIAGYDQVGRVLKNLVDVGDLLRIGYELYTKARRDLHHHVLDTIHSNDLFTIENKPVIFDEYRYQHSTFVTLKLILSLRLPETSIFKWNGYKYDLPISMLDSL